MTSIKLGIWIAKHVELEPPKSAMGKVLRSATRQWAVLERFLVDGRLPIDNGAPERLNRIVALGRRNHLFAGSEDGGHRAAIMYSLLGGCLLSDIDPSSYLEDVLDRLAAGWPASRISELVPANWAAAHQAAILSN